MSHRGFRNVVGLGLFFSLWSLVACGGAETGQRPMGDELRVEDAVAVAIPGGSTGAVYLTLLNPTETDDTLLKVSTPAARAAEVHETLEEDGVLRMEAFPEGLPVPAGSRIELAPGGKHVMLLALPEELVPGETLELTLHFDQAGPKTLTVPIRESVL